MRIDMRIIVDPFEWGQSLVVIRRYRGGRLERLGVIYHRRAVRLRCFQIFFLQIGVILDPDILSDVLRCVVAEFAGQCGFQVQGKALDSH